LRFSIFPEEHVRDKLTYVMLEHLPELGNVVAEVFWVVVSKLLCGC